MSKIHQLTQGLFRDTPEEFLLLNKATYHGMAHFAGTGPAGKTCRECTFWMKTGRWVNDQPADAKCSKHRQFTMDRKGPAFPHKAASCKYFEHSSDPQPLVRPS